eukprot:2274951-Amphidinium_carterae.1
MQTNRDEYSRKRSGLVPNYFDICPFCKTVLTLDIFGGGSGVGFMTPPPPEPPESQKNAN